jgi:putative DNA primase/helicase
MTRDEIMGRLDFPGFYAARIPGFRSNGAANVTVRCVFHDDHDPSMSVNVETGLFNCKVCSARGSPIDFLVLSEGITVGEAIRKLAEIVGGREAAPKATTQERKRLKAPWPKKKGWPATALYEYTLDGGAGRALKVRYQGPEGKKVCGWYERDGADLLSELGDRKADLYLLPALREGITRGALIVLNEGEKACDRLRVHDGDDTRDFVGTSGPNGEGSFDRDGARLAEQLRGAAEVLAIVDRDDAGERWARAVQRHVGPVVGRLRFARAAVDVPKADLFDHLEASLGLGELEDVTIGDAAPEKEATKTRAWIPADVREMLTAKPRPIRFLIDRLIAEEDGCVITAAPKDGKTFLAASIAIELPLGRKVFGYYAVPGPLRVLWLDEEMGIVKLQRRLQRLALGLQLGAEEIDAVGKGLCLFPQQGMTLTSRENVQAFHAEVERFKPALVIVDSFAAVTTGIDDGNPERRAFYMNAIAPLRRMGTACLLLAHPPLPSREAHANAGKRPRGGGDILGTVDRGLYLEKIAEENTPEGRIVTTTLGELFSREGAGLEALQTITIEDVGPDATIVKSSGGDAAAFSATVGKTNAACRELLHLLRQAPKLEMYQPALKQALARDGHNQDTVKGAISALLSQRLIELLPPRPPNSGKWIRATEDACATE